MSYSYSHSSKKHKSVSQRKRESFNYREAYFQKNPGLFGFIWFCSQCGIPLFGKDNVQVDHIVPLASWGINRTINTVAICPKCNKEKSAKGGVYIVKGSIAKIFEIFLFSIQKLFLHLVVILIRLIHAVLFGIIDVLKVIVDYLGINNVLLLVMICIFIICIIIALVRK